MMTLVLMFSLLPTMAFADEGDGVVSNITHQGEVTCYDADGNPVTSGDWAVELHKTIEATANPNQYNITLDVQVAPDKTINTTQTVGADIVMVFDMSKSMDGARWASLTAASDSFIDAMLGNGNPNHNRIAIVGYGETYAMIRDWTDSSTTARNSYRNGSGTWKTWSDMQRAYSLGSYTNCQAGFYAADQMLNGSRDNSAQYVVYMSDGEANRYYKHSNNISYTPTSNLGSDTETSVTAAKEQATRLKQNHSGAKIYTVGLGTGSNAVLDPNHSYVQEYGFWLGPVWIETSTETIHDGNTAVNEFHEGTTANIQIIYNQIGTQIVLETHPWTVYDPMSVYVDLAGGSFSGDGAADPAIVKTDMNGARIVWDLRALAAANPSQKHFTLTYAVTLDDNVNSWENHPAGNLTNDTTQLVFKINETSGGTTVSHDAVTVNFDVPKVKADVYSVTLKYFVDGVEQTGLQGTVSKLDGTELDLTSADYQKTIGSGYTSFVNRKDDAGIAIGDSITVNAANNGKVICYYYETAYPLTIHYYDADTGNSIAGVNDYVTSIPVSNPSYSVPSPDVDGYHLVNGANATVIGTISGPTVINVYYEKNYYQVHYSFTGSSSPEGVAAPVDGTTYRLGDPVTVQPAMSDEHYNFSGWSTGNFTIDGTITTTGSGTQGDPCIISITGSWTAKSYNLDMIYQFSEQAKLDEFLAGREAAANNAEYAGDASEDEITAAKEQAVAAYDAGWNLGTFAESYTAANGTDYDNVFVKVPKQSMSYNTAYDLTSSQVDVPNYKETLADGSAAVSGNLAQNSTVRVLLNNDLFQVTVNHYKQTRSGYELVSPSDISAKNSGDSYTVASRDINGYTLKADDASKLGEYPVSGDVTVNLYYDATPYTANFNFTNTAPEGVIAPTEQGDIWFGEKVAAPGTTVPNGWSFSGWQTRTGDGTKEAPYVYSDYNFDTAISSDVLLYGTWTQLQYTVNFGFVGGDNIPGTASAPLPQTLTYGQQATQPAVDASAYSTDAVTYHFDGWYTSSTTFDDTTRYSFDTSVTTTPVYLYGNWTAEANSYSYTVQHWDLDKNVMISETTPTPASLRYGTVIADSTTTLDGAGTYALGSSALDSYYGGTGCGEFVSAEGCTIGTTGNVIKCNYQAKSFGLIVHYVYQDQTPVQDNNGNSLDFSQNCKYSTPYSVSSPAVPHYHVDALQENDVDATLNGSTVAGTMPGHDVTLTVVYAQDTQYKVTINYLDKATGNSIEGVESKEIGGFYAGDPISVADDYTSGKSIEKYSYDSMDSIPTNIGNGDVTVNVYFTRDTYTFVEKHIDNVTGSEIANTGKQQTLNVGNDYTTAALTGTAMPSNYKLVSGPVVTGTATKGGAVAVTYYYGPKADAAVNIQYILVEADGEGWKDLETLGSSSNNYKESDPYDLSSTVAAWGAAHSQYTQVKSDEMTGTLNGAETKTLKVYYTLNSYEFTVKYYNDHSNTEIAPTQGMNVTGTAPYGFVLNQEIVSRTLENINWMLALSPSGYSIDKIVYVAIGTDSSKNIIEVHYNYTPYSGGGGHDDEYDPPVVISNNPTPLSPTPGTTTTIPDGDVPQTEIPDEETPLAATPAKTGDNLILWVLAAGASGIGLVWVSLMGRKRRDEDGSQN